MLDQRIGPTGLPMVKHWADSKDLRLVPYTSAVPNKICLAELDKHYAGWRFLLSPASVTSFGKKRKALLYERGYAIDNGVFSYFKKGIPFDKGAFISLLDKYADRADWIVIPDVVGSAAETGEILSYWLWILRKYDRPLLYVAQDGCEDHDYLRIRGLTSIGYGIFVGGTTEFKLTHSEAISHICIEAGVVCHIGRVNSAKRVRLCESWSVVSFDGSGMSRFQKTARIVSSEVAKFKE